MEIQGKIVLLTGAAGGIGAALARALVSRGANVVLLDLEGEAAQRIATELGPKALALQADITRPEELYAAVAAIIERFGRLDVVVANAGIVTVGSVERGNPQQFRRVIEVNLLGTWNTLRTALPSILEAQGYILCVSSLAGELQAPLHAAYNASKAGIRALANTLRLEVQGRGVDVGVAHLMYTATAAGRGAVEHPLMQALPGLSVMKPETVEQTAAQLARGIERRARVIAKPSARIALLAPGLFQRALEWRARRRRWAATIQEREREAEQ